MKKTESSPPLPLFPLPSFQPLPFLLSYFLPRGGSGVFRSKQLVESTNSGIQQVGLGENQEIWGRLLAV